MKKIYSIAASLFLSVAMFAQGGPALNPYAYGVSTVDNADGTLTINYALNTDADSAKLVTYNYGEEVATQALSDITVGAHSVVVTLPEANGKYSFGIRVNGTSPEAPTKISTIYSFWSPYGMAIDKNPASANFGRLLLCEADTRVAAKPAYHAGGKGAGIYAFNPDFTPVAEGAVFNGGLAFTEFIAETGVRAYNPHDVVISEDGRIFATIMNQGLPVVCELSADLQTWTPVLSGTFAENGVIYNEDSTFLAGMPCSIDVKGSGENLKLLIYSCDNRGLAYSQAGFRLDEYALGTATTFVGTPTHIELFDGAYGLAPVFAQVHYDLSEEGGYWFTASRGGNDGQPNLAHFNAAGVRDYYSESAEYYGGAGIAQHDGKIYMGGNSGFIQAYTATPGESGMTIAAAGAQITTGNGRNVNAIEFDYAGNMYSCSNSGEKLIAFAMPYSGVVETPVQGAWQVGPVVQMIANPLGEDGRFIVKYDCETGEWADANPEIGETFTFAVDVTGSWLEEWVNANENRGLAINKWTSRGDLHGDAVRFKRISGNIWGMTANFAQQAQGWAADALANGAVTTVYGQIFGFEGSQWYIWDGHEIVTTQALGTDGLFQFAPSTGRRDADFMTADMTGEMYGYNVPGYAEPCATLKPVLPEHLWIIGECATATWNPSASKEMTKTADGVFEVVETMTGTWFAFSASNSETWDEVNAARYGANPSGATVTLGQAEAITGVAGDYCFTVPAAGTYKFVVDLNAMTVTVTEEASALDNVETNKAQKIFRDGQVIIIRDGREYNVQGMLVK